MSDKKATLTIDGLDDSIELPIYSGSLGPDVVDVGGLTSKGMFTYDPGFVSTASCESQITYIDGGKGVLLENPIRFAVVAPLDDSALWIFGRGVDSPHLKRLRVCHTQMPGLVDDNNRNFCRNFVQLLAGRVAHFGQLRVVITEANDHLNLVDRLGIVLAVLALARLVGQLRRLQFLIQLFPGPAVVPEHDVARFESEGVILHDVVDQSPSVGKWREAGPEVALVGQTTSDEQRNHGS